MRRAALLSACLLMLLSPGPVRAEQQLTALVLAIRPAVVTVITYNRQNKILAQGSGFFIDDLGRAITCFHVMKGAYRAEVRNFEQKTFPVRSVVGENKDLDLVKLRVEIPRSDYHWIRLSDKQTAVAEQVVVIGSPLGLEQTVSDGIVSAIRQYKSGLVYQISAPISPGSSGSPVANMRGEIIGVASFQSIKGQNLNFAIPGEYVLNLKDHKARTVSQWSTGKKSRIKLEKGPGGIPVLTNR